MFAWPLLALFNVNCRPQLLYTPHALVMPV